MLRARISCCTAVLVATVTLVACSDGARQLSPAGPSSMPALGAAAAGSSVNSTSYNVADRTRGSPLHDAVLAAWAARSEWETAADSIPLEGTEIITAAGSSATCPDRTITVAGLNGILDASTVYLPGISCASLVVGMTVHTKGVLTFATATYQISEISLVADAPGGGGEGTDYDEVTGTVANLKGPCPNVTMVVHGVRVTTTGSTTYGTTGDCGNLRAGTRVTVEGTIEEDGSMTAVTIQILDQPGGKPPSDLVEREGVVASLKGSCKTLTMVVRGYPVMTTDATTFLGGVCGDIRQGTRIRAQGTTAGNSLLATSVEILP